MKQAYNYPASLGRHPPSSSLLASTNNLPGATLVYAFALFIFFRASLYFYRRNDYLAPCFSILIILDTLALSFSLIVTGVWEVIFICATFW